jgi:hypothetical protein
MKRTLQPQLVQNWTLAGMKPMHRALVLRTVQSIFVKANDAFSLSWHVEERSLLETMFRPGVLILDRGTMLDALAVQPPHSHSANEVANEVKNRSTNQIRLLWSWTLRGQQDLLWCTELSFAGVIHDIPSLERWSRVCLGQAKQVEVPGNAIIAGIQLPKLTP